MEQGIHSLSVWLWTLTYDLDNSSLAKVDPHTKNWGHGSNAGFSSESADRWADRCYQTYYLPATWSIIRSRTELGLYILRFVFSKQIPKYLSVSVRECFVLLRWDAGHIWNAIRVRIIFSQKEDMQGGISPLMCMFFVAFLCLDLSLWSSYFAFM